MWSLGRWISCLSFSGQMHLGVEACVICVGDNQACSFSGTTESCLCDLGFENDGGTGDCTSKDSC